MKDSEGNISLEGGMRLHYRIIGKGPKTIVIPNARSLAEEIRSLGEKWRLIFYDQRGRGGSSEIVDDSLIWTDYEVQDIDKLRTHFRLSRFSLMGWSYMGGIAALYAQAYPGYVSRLVLICPISIRQPAPYDEERREAELEAEAKIDQIELKKLEEMQDRHLQESDPLRYCQQNNRVYVPLRMADPNDFANLKADPCIYPNEWPDNLSKHWRTHFPPESLKYDWRESVTRLEIPVLIVHGNQDLIPRASSEEWAASLPNARLVSIDECGHFPFVEAPRTFFPAVEHFLEGK